MAQTITSGFSQTTEATDPIYTAKGDLAVGTGAGTSAKVTVGTDGQMLIADSTQTAGVAWTSAESLIEQIALPAGFTTDAGGFTSTPALASNLNRLRNNITNQASFFTSGSLYVTAIPLRRGMTLTGAWFVNGNTALVAGSGVTWHQWFVLLDSDGVTILRKTSDDGSGAWTNVTPKLLPFTSQFTTTHDGLHYLGVCVNATGGSGSTLPNVLGNSAINSNQLKIASKFTPPLLGVANTSLTDPASLVTVTARASWTDPSVYATPWCGVY